MMISTKIPDSVDKIAFAFREAAFFLKRSGMESLLGYHYHNLFSISDFLDDITPSGVGNDDKLKFATRLINDNQCRWEVVCHLSELAMSTHIGFDFGAEYEVFALLEKYAPKAYWYPHLSHWISTHAEFMAFTDALKTKGLMNKIGKRTDLLVGMNVLEEADDIEWVTYHARAA